MKKQIDIETQFYKELDDTDFYTLDGFYMKLYDADNEQCYLYENQKAVEKIQIVQFYLIENKYQICGEVQYKKIKDLGNGYSILMVIPFYYARDKRIVFDKLKNIKQVNLYEVRKLWKDVDLLGVNLEVVEIKNIPSSLISKDSQIAENFEIKKFAKRKLGKIKKFAGERILIKPKASSVKKEKIYEKNENVFRLFEKKSVSL